MTEDQGLMLWSRLKAVYGPPRKSDEASADLFTEEWLPILDRRDYDIANGALTSMIEERTYNSFPMPGEFLRYYKSESGPRQTDTGPETNWTEKYYLRACNLPKEDWTDLRADAEEAVSDWIRRNPHMKGFEGKRIIYEIARLFAQGRDLPFWPGLSEEPEVPF